MSWLRTMVGKVFPETPNDEAAAAGGDAVDGADGAEAFQPVLDSLQKIGRLQARQGARIEDLEGKLEAGFTDLRNVLARNGAARPSTWAPRWDELLDAADGLDEGIRHAEGAGLLALAQGLRTVAGRMARFLGEADVTRVSPLGRAPDGGIVRVVGTIEQVPEGASALADGQVARVVRAAALQGGRLLREGEVLVYKTASDSGGEA